MAPPEPSSFCFSTDSHRFIGARLRAPVDAGRKTTQECAMKCDGQRIKISREMGGAPRNLAPRSHFLAWTVKPSGCHCTDGHLTGRVFTEEEKQL